VSSAVESAAPYSPARIAGIAGFGLGLTLYAALAAAATIIFPPLGAAFLLPLAVAIIAVAPAARATPRRLAFSLLVVSALLLPVWPVYLFVKLGPLPIVTPPRLFLYAASLLWTYDMTFSPWRRAQFAFAVKKSGAATGLVFLFFALGLFSLPLAEGRSMAIPEFVRQLIIWLIPFCVVLTYCRRQRDFVLLMRVFTLGAAIVALIAIAEAASGRLLADILSPFIADDAEWLRNVQEAKVRDGVFRAQGSHTHPLSLGEHLAMSAPFALAFLLSARRFKARAFWSAALITIVLAAVATNSRGAMLVMALTLAAMGALLGYRFLSRAAVSRWRPLAGLIAAVGLALSPVMAVGAYAVIAGKGGASAANSTQSRVDQIEMAWPKIMKRPVGGYGTGRSARVLGYWGRTLTVDNYYLTLALDLGLPGPLTLLAMMIAWSAASIRRSRRSHPALGVVFVAAAAAAASIAISRSITSQTGNLAIVFFMIAAFAGSSVSFSRRKSRNRV
jgi:hypothetical protein